MFAPVGVRQPAVQGETADRIEASGGPIIQESVGSGANLPFTVRQGSVGETYWVDQSIRPPELSPEDGAPKRNLPNLFVDKGKQPPFADEAIGVVFDAGGMNCLDNSRWAIEEMVRVAQSDTRILIAEGTEKGALVRERLGPGFHRSTADRRDAIQPPLGLILSEGRGIRLFEVWKD